MGNEVLIASVNLDRSNRSFGPFVPAKAETQRFFQRKHWIPAGAGMSGGETCRSVAEASSRADSRRANNNTGAAAGADIKT
jgi:hypothetical protein